MIYKYGSSGPVVAQIQKALSLLPDGKFGLETERAVCAFQRENGLKEDGKVGPATMAKLIPVRWKRSKRHIDKIIIHCSATPEGENCTVEQIRAQHKKQGWSDIGYHYVIYRDGTVHEGRSVDVQGAHCADGGGNIGSIGICYVGGVEAQRNGVPYSKLRAKDTRTLSQKAALMKLLGELRTLYPEAKIYGHNDFSNKACPCFDAKREYAMI